MDEFEATVLGVARAEFGLPALGISAGGRGARAQIWRLRVDGAPDLAVKFHRWQPSEQAVAAQVAHTTAMIGHGVRAAASLADRRGRYLSPAGDGWLRVFEWIDGTAAEPADPMTPSRLGEVLGLMHAHAAATTHELDGGAPRDWYQHPPRMAVLRDRVAAAEKADPRWAGRLDAALPALRTLSGITKAPASLVWCHRDLHPGNVLRTAEGRFAVLDWESLGPADPAQEFASVLLHWFADSTGAQGPFIEGFLAAYRGAGGRATLTGIDDFAMHLADRLNFLALQLESATSPQAVAEIEETLHLLPTLDVLVQCVTAATNRR